MKKLTTILSAVLAMTLVACSNTSQNATTTAESASAQASSAASAAADSAWPRSVDSLVVSEGKTTGATEKIELTAKPERIVSTSVTLTGSLLAIDAPVVASGGGQPGATANESGFFHQWAATAQDKGVESLYILEPNLEKILAQNPDLIVVSAAGADSVTAIHDQLKDIAPVVVVDYSNQSWEDLMTELGAITGQEDQAKETLKEFSTRLEEVKSSITLPEQPTNFAIVQEPGKGMNFWSTQSAQGQLLSEVGFDFVQPGDEVIDTSGVWAKRTDVKHVAQENIDKAINGKSLFVMYADGNEDPVEQLTAIAQVADTEPVRNGAVYGFGSSFFRMDFFSAMALLDRLEELFKK